MRFLNVYALGVGVVTLSGGFAYGQGPACDALAVLPLSRWTLEEHAAIRLDDEARRGGYAQSIMQKADKLFVVKGGSSAETALRFSSLYTRMLGDPENVRRYFSTKSEARRAAELRQGIFRTKGPRVRDNPATAAELAPVSKLLDEAVLQRWRSEDWIGDFPVLVINRAPPSRFRELMLLEQNAGDFLADERHFEKAGLMALGDGATTIRAEFISKQGALTVRSYAALATALYDLQVLKPQLCAVYLQFSRSWLSRSFVERYAASYRVADVHLHGQVSIWDDGARVSIRDWNIFPLLRDSFFAVGAIFAIKGDRIILDRWVLEPLVASAQ